VLLRDASGSLEAVSLAAIGYGIGLLLSWAFLLAGRDALGRQRR
jgi:hypothetical protein